MRIFLKIIVCLITIGFSFTFLNAQPYNELGVPYIKNYPPKEYKGRPQIFGVTQDTSEIVYFTGYGITEYDGETWRKIPDLKTATWAAKQGNDKRIYIGGTGDLGYLKAKTFGQQEFISLLPLLPKKYQNLGELRQIAVVDENVFFASRTVGCLIRYNYSSKKMKVWQQEGNISILGTIYNELYLYVSDLGFCKLVGDEIKLLFEENIFTDSPVVSVAPYDREQLLICTKDKGLFLYYDSKIIPFKTEADELLKTSAYFIKALPDSTFLISILGQGIIVIDEKGKWIRHLNKNKGLVNDMILTSHIDKSGGIWLGTFDGLSKIDLVSPLSKFENDINGRMLSFNDVTRFKGYLFGASAETNGFVYLDKDGAIFREVKMEGGGQAFSFVEFGKSLYGLGVGGVYEINESTAKSVYKGNNIDLAVYTIHKSQLDSNHIFIGTLPDGLDRVNREKNTWKFEHKYTEISNTVKISNFLEYPAGNLWLGTEGFGLWLVKYNIDSLIESQHFEKGRNNLNLNSTLIHTYLIDSLVTITGIGGIYIYKESENKLIPDSRFPLPIPSSDIHTVRLVESKPGIIYASFSSSKNSTHLGVYRKQGGGNYIFETAIFQQIPQEDILSVYDMYPDTNGVLWIADNSGLIRFDTKKEIQTTTVPTKIRQVFLNSDSLIFAGHGIPAKPTLSITQSNINFHYLAPTINITGTNQYQTKLEGFDKKWSDWTTKTEKAYTNLHEGSYTFKAKGKTPSGQLTKEASYSFTVLPPWWRTWWAYLSYVFLGGLSLYLFGQWRNRQLLKRSKELELIIEERTAEIKELFQEAKEARAAAEAANEAKSTFLSTVSHELRTPLTSVIGFAKIIKKRLDERILPFVQSDEKKTQRAIKQVTQNLDVVVSEGERLTTLINDVLDLAKIEAGRFDWHMDMIQIEAVIKQATAATSALFEQKALPLELAIDKTLPAINADKDRLVQVVINLISNAVKFTDEGTIKVSAIQENGSIVVSVKDSGIGISKEDLPKVFEKFKQVGDTLTDKPKGTGLGLPICKEIVEHHQGKIWAESEFGQGSTFKFTIPLSAEQPIDATTSSEKEGTPTAVHQTQKAASIIKGETIEKTILIVDDEREIRNLLRQEISEVGYLVKEAINGKEGIELIRQAQPDLVILDIMMPEMNGFDVAAILKNDPATKHIPIIVVSITDDKKRIAQLGIERYLTKPIDINQLLKEINVLLS